MDIQDVHKNSKLLLNNIPYNVDDAEFMKPGKGRAVYRLRLRNLLDGSILDRTYHSGEAVEEVLIETHEMQYLYKEADHYVFMNSETFEQNFITEEQMGDRKYYIKEGTVVQVMMMGDKPLDIVVPTFVELQVTGSTIATRTDTITAQMKVAVLETGLNIDVPAFIKEGDIIKVDTRTGNYVERVSAKK